MLDGDERRRRFRQAEADARAAHVPEHARNPLAQGPYQRREQKLSTPGGKFLIHQLAGGGATLQICSRGKL